MFFPTSENIADCAPLRAFNLDTITFYRQLHERTVMIMLNVAGCTCPTRWPWCRNRQLQESSMDTRRAHCAASCGRWMGNSWNCDETYDEMLWNVFIGDISHLSHFFRMLKPYRFAIEIDFTRWSTCRFVCNLCVGMNGEMLARLRRTAEIGLVVQRQRC